jgi:hypothetical protein
LLKLNGYRLRYHREAAGYVPDPRFRLGWMVVSLRIRLRVLRRKQQIWWWKGHPPSGYTGKAAAPSIGAQVALTLFNHSPVTPKGRRLLIALVCHRHTLLRLARHWEVPGLLHLPVCVPLCKAALDQNQFSSRRPSSKGAERPAFYIITGGGLLVSGSGSSRPVYAYGGCSPGSDMGTFTGTIASQLQAPAREVVGPTLSVQAASTILLRGAPESRETLGGCCIGPPYGWAIGHAESGGCRPLAHSPGGTSWVAGGWVSAGLVGVAACDTHVYNGWSCDGGVFSDHLPSIGKICIALELVIGGVQSSASAYVSSAVPPAKG